MRGVKRKLSPEGTGCDGMGRWWAKAGIAIRRSWKKLPACQVRIESPVPFADQVQGRYLGQLAWEAYQAGIARDALDVHPRYLRASDAELKLKAGLVGQQAPRGGIECLH